MEAFMVWVLCGAITLLVSLHLRQDSNRVRFVLIAFSIAATVRYVIWRAVMMPDIDASAATVAKYAFFAVEMVATYMAVDDMLTLRRTRNRSSEVDRQLGFWGERPPRIDVLVATYNEPWEVLEKTIVGATSLNYPNYRVWILDDGNRGWLKERAAAAGVEYVARSDNTHYKAGNLNHGMAAIRARGYELEFVALLDADFIARPEFLRRTLALMKNPSVGIVQTPQYFYNPDPHQQAFGGVRNWPDEQRGWFDVYLPALDALGAASCCGTSCLIRVAALDAIGGFPTESVCEDTLTSFKMRPKGFSTVMLEERLTVGLAPEGIGEFLTQRARWILGGVQNTRFMGAAPGFAGRVRYWLFLWRLAIFGIMPPLWVVAAIVFWFTGISLIHVENFEQTVSYFGPLWLMRLAWGWLFRGRTQPFVSDAVWMLLSPLWLRESYRAIMGSKARFKVTDKALHKHERVVHFRLLPFHATLLGLLLAGFAYNMFDPTAPLHHEGFFQANSVLSIWFTAVILAGVAPVIEPPKRRRADRYPTSESVAAIAGDRRMTWRCRDLSLGGALVELGDEPAPPRVTLVLAEVGALQAVLVRRVGKRLAAFEFESEGEGARARLVRKLYFGDRYILAPAGWGFFRPLGAFLKHALL